MVRTDVMKELKFHPDCWIEDWDLWIRIGMKYKIRTLNRITGQYRSHDKNRTLISNPETQKWAKWVRDTYGGK